MLQGIRAGVRLAAVVAIASTVAPAAALAGPPLIEPEADRLAALHCADDIAGSERTPVLLIHGTGVTAEENWAATYQPQLEAQGRPTCTVQMPDRGYGDVQVTAEVVATAIREASHLAGRRISIIGHSQGAFQTMYALRVWPDLADNVEDAIGLAGVYGYGSEAMVDDCGDGDGCVPSFWQMRSGSALQQSLARRPMPEGFSFTTIGTLADETVTPQPEANALPGAKVIQIQEVCADRKQLVGQDHALMAGDAVAYALVMDALKHSGPAEPGRIPKKTCDQIFFEGLDFVTFASTLPDILTSKGDNVLEEPALRCYLQPACTDPDARGRVIERARVNGGGLVVTAVEAATLKVRVGTQRWTRRLAPGRNTLRLRLPAGQQRLVLRTRTAAFDRFATEVRRSIGA